MDSSLETFIAHSNDSRYRAQPRGHYESFFQRANHPSRPLAFWIRYTIFSPRHHAEEAVGELWAIFFNGETGDHVVVKQVVPFSGCTFSPSAFQVQIAGASLQQGQLQGSVQMGDTALAWDLTYRAEEAPLLPSALAPICHETALCEKPRRRASGGLSGKAGRERGNHRRKPVGRQPES